MKQTFTKSMILLLGVVIALGFTSQDDKGKVHLKVTKDENGDKSVFEKTYESMKALQADEELKAFDVMVRDWANEHEKGIFVQTSIQTDEDFSWTSDDGEVHDGQKMIIKRKGNGNNEMVFITEDDEAHEGEKHIVIKKEDGSQEVIDIKKEKIIKVKTKDGEQNFTMEIDGDSDGKMIWVDEDGNTTELTQEKIEQLAEEHKGEAKHISKRIEIISDDEDEKTYTVVVETDGEGEKTSVVEVEIEKEVNENGEETIIKKNVWVTENGEKVELNGDDDYQFESDGKKMKIVVKGETMDISDFNDENLEGDKEMVFVQKGEGNGEQFMNVDVEEKNGETFIEIEIKRDEALSLSISEIMKTDASLNNIKFSLKNNLKPSQLNYYPNPNNGKFNLKFDMDQEGEVTVKVMDILGKEVYKETILDFRGKYDNQLDLTGHEKGVYVMQVVQGKKMLSRKILIE